MHACAGSTRPDVGSCQGILHVFRTVFSLVPVGPQGDPSGCRHCARQLSSQVRVQSYPEQMTCVPSGKGGLHATCSVSIVSLLAVSETAVSLMISPPESEKDVSCWLGSSPLPVDVSVVVMGPGSLPGSPSQAAIARAAAMTIILQCHMAHLLNNGAFSRSDFPIQKSLQHIKPIRLGLYRGLIRWSEDTT